MALSMAVKKLAIKNYICTALQVQTFHTSSILNRTYKHPERTRFKKEYVYERFPPKGKIISGRPFKIELEAGRHYYWCACGLSKNQVLCDGSHKELWTTQRNKKHLIKWRGHHFQVKETKEYWLCNCKQTNNRPFCDGSHKKDLVTKKNLH